MSELIEKFPWEQAVPIAIALITGVPALITAVITYRRLMEEAPVRDADAAQKLAEAAASLSEQQSRVIMETYARLEKEINSLKAENVLLRREIDALKERDKRYMSFIEVLRDAIRKLRQQLIDNGITPIREMPDMPVELRDRP